MYKITYRKLDGRTDTVSILAVSEAIARALFYQRYDGRIITIELVEPL